MKASLRLVSPAGFLLVLLLFLFLPFLSVSCEVPGMGAIGADYNGAQLATGAEPAVEIPQGLEDMADELPGGSSTSSEPPPDPGVQVLAIIVGVVLLAGVALPFVPRLRDRLRERLFGGAAVALLAGVLVVVTQTVAQSNLTAQLKDDAQSLSEDEVSTPDINSVAAELIHTEVGFWLSLVALVLIALLSVGFVVKDKIVPPPAPAAAPGTAPPPDGMPPAPDAQGAPVTADQPGNAPGEPDQPPVQPPSEPPRQQS